MGMPDGVVPVATSPGCVSRTIGQVIRNAKLPYQRRHATGHCIPQRFYSCQLALIAGTDFSSTNGAFACEQVH